MSEDERHGFQLRKGARLRNYPRNQSRFDILLDPHEAITVSRFRERMNDSIVELERCARFVHASQATHDYALQRISYNHVYRELGTYLC